MATLTFLERCSSTVIPCSFQTPILESTVFALHIFFVASRQWGPAGSHNGRMQGCGDVVIPTRGEFTTLWGHVRKNYRLSVRYNPTDYHASWIFCSEDSNRLTRKLDFGVNGIASVGRASSTDDGCIARANDFLGSWRLPRPLGQGLRRKREPQGLQQPGDSHVRPPRGVQEVLSLIKGVLHIKAPLCRDHSERPVISNNEAHLDRHFKDSQTTVVRLLEKTTLFLAVLCYLPKPLATHGVVMYPSRASPRCSQPYQNSLWYLRSASAVHLW